MKWSKYSDQCKNCKSNRRKHRARGYCTKCYPYIVKIEHSKNWDINDIKTLKEYPKSWVFQDPHTFKKIKINLPKQWQLRLDWLRYREETLKGQVSGIEIEEGLRRIAKMCRVRNKYIFFGSVGWINQNFNQKQKKQIFEWIDRIEQDVPWSVNWTDVFITR